MDWRTSDEQSNHPIDADGGLAPQTGRRTLAGLPGAAAEGRAAQRLALDETLHRDLCLARGAGARFGGSLSR